MTSASQTAVELGISAGQVSKYLTLLVAPADIQERVSNDVRTITADAAFRAKIAVAGSAARTGTSAEFAAAIEDQRAKIAAIHQATRKPPQ